MYGSYIESDSVQCDLKLSSFRNPMVFPCMVQICRYGSYIEFGSVQHVLVSISDSVNMQIR